MAALLAGYITGCQALLDYNLLDETHVAFIILTLSDTTAASLKKFNAAVKVPVAVEQCNMIAGNFEYLLKVRTTDIQEYRTLLGEKIAALPFVSHTSTFLFRWKKFVIGKKLIYKWIYCY